MQTTCRVSFVEGSFTVCNAAQPCWLWGDIRGSNSKTSGTEVLINGITNIVQCSVLNAQRQGTQVPGYQLKCIAAEHSERSIAQCLQTCVAKPKLALVSSQ